MVQTGIENEPVAVRSAGDGKASADPAVCLCVLGGGAHIPTFVVGSVRLDSVLQTEGSILEPCYEIWELLGR
jgi:hypothetical protein